MIRIAVVEDEKACQSELSAFIERFGKENGQSFHVTSFSDGLDIVEDYHSTWDIIFMDIKMKYMDGMTAAKKIRGYDSAVILIFITTMAQFAIRGYEVDALDFVLKPVSYTQFSAKMLKALKLLQKMEQKYLLLPSEDGTERVSTNEILFIEVKNHYLYITARGQTYVVRRPLAAMEQELQGYHFVRCNNSYLVNLRNVTGIQKDTVCLEQYELPISRTKKKQFLHELSDYLGTGYQ